MKNPTKYNILLITSDQQRRDSIGIYANGKPAKTPNLDALGNDGIVYDRAYTPHATCTPARSSILTGQYASRHGAYTIGTALDWNCLKVSDLLKNDGYETYAVGKMHFRPVSTAGEFESVPNILDFDFWREHKYTYYGFDNCQLLNRHSSSELSWGMDYGVWLMEKHGFTRKDCEKYFDGRHLESWDLPREAHQSVYVAEKTIEAINDKKNDSKKPFFIWASFPDPHAPLVAPAPYDTLFDPKEVSYLPPKDGEFDDKPACYRQLFEAGHPKELPFSDKYIIPSAYSLRAWTEDDIRQGIAIHNGMVTLMDEEIGRIIAALKNTGQYDNTIIIFTCDHGDTLGNHGFSGKGLPAYEEVYNIPFIIKLPESMNRAGERTQALAGLQDIAPTLLALNGLEVPETMQGITLFSAPERQNFVVENRLVEKGFYQKMIISQNYKLVVYENSNDGELYDLVNDRDQYCNLWSHQGYGKIKLELLNQLANYYSENKIPQKFENDNAALSEIFDYMQQENVNQSRTSFS